MNRERILEQAERFVRRELAGDSGGHDWWHIRRVVATARTLAREEGADPFVCELAALLHDVADEKLNPSAAEGMRKVTDFLDDSGVSGDVRQHVVDIVSTMSFAGGGGRPMASTEGRVVQDADRLDALGAVGIARTFAYAGSTGGVLHDPELPPRERMTKEEYRSGKSTAINHFYEKLLKLKDRMNTAAARRMADERHRVMETFLEQFYAEWNGEK